MDANATVELLKGWSSLIGAISWPLVIVFVLLYFGQPLRAFLQNLREFKFGAGGVEVSLLTKQQAEAAAYLGAGSAEERR